ncbi:MAG: glycosyl hydrolase [Bacteroidota bacterium]
MTKKHSLLIGITLLVFGFTTAQSTKSLVLTRPADGATSSDNVPVLTWQAMEGHTFDIWIDGIKMGAGVPENWFIPFPLSYGKHNWRVVAFRENAEVSSQTGDFTVRGEPLSPVPENAVLLREDWKVISSILAGKDGSSLSKKKVNLRNWKNTSVPATVLSVMVRNGLYPNPYLGTNNMKIPDLSDAFNEKYGLIQYSHIEGRNPWQAPYWYRRTFEIPAGYAGKKIWLTLGEINYRAEVWLNGKQLADTSQVVGMERFFRFDISSVASMTGENILALAIYPPDHPGIPADAPITPLAPPGLNMANGMISKDYTRWDVIGWDWIPAIRDRDMGITEDVYIYATDDIELDNLYVTSDLPLPSTAYADVTLSADLVNHSSHTMEGTITATISRENEAIVVEQEFKVEAKDTLELLWDKKNMPQLQIKNPSLWWPLGYGDPALYTLSIEAVSGNQKSTREIRFGIREVETYMGANERVYKINGKEIYIKGGNWVLDMMLNWTRSRYEQEILLTKHANLNMLRVWGPTGAPPESFYDFADRHGILLWQDFLNDFWGTFRNTPGMCPEMSLFEKATVEIVKRYRNHPSLVIWCGGNEGPNPREELITSKILPENDGRDSKHYLKISNGDGLHGGGPYHTILPEAYFSDPKLSGFSSEVGPSGVPEYESVKKFMPDRGETWKPGRFPLDGVWAYHDAINFEGSDMRKFTHYDDIVRNLYGAPDSTYAGIEDYLDKCQFVNHDVYRACMEKINSQLWSNSSGILLWKSNSAWPSVVWQVYDWYLQSHAGFYGIRKSAAPQTIQFNRGSKKIEVINASPDAFRESRVTAVLYDETLTKIWEESENLDMDQNSVYELDGTVPVTEKVCFLKLELQNRSGEVIMDNFYWLSTVNNFKSFNTLPEPGLKVVARKATSDKDHASYKVTLSNTGDNLALMTRLKLVDPVSGLEILPSYWSDNYISMLPGEKKSIQVEIASDNLPGLMLEYKAFNMKEPKQITLPLSPTIDRQATKETIKLYNNLMELSRQYTLFGHQDDPAYGIGWAYEPGKSDCKITAGSYPAVYGWELGGLELGNKMNLDDVPFDTMRDLIIEGYLRGGVTTISWHEYSPLSGKDAWADTGDTVNQTVPSILPGGSHHGVFVDHLDKVADFLNTLKTPEGVMVPVIFRPFHENTGSWFWWGEKHCTPEQYQALFQFTVHYLKEERQLHHLLYCYSPASSNFNSAEDFLLRYPGDDYVDILGFDQYRIKSGEESGASAIRRMEILAGLAAERDKLYAFTETGDYGLKTANWFTEHLLPILNANDKTRGIAYVLVWRNEERQVDHFFVPYQGHEQAEDFKKFRENDLILFEDDLPENLYK